MPGSVTSLWSRARSWAASECRFLVLTYHRVLDQPDPLFPDAIDRPTFDEQIRTLVRHFNVRPLNETITRAFAGTLRPATVCITFDDGYADNVCEALPILQRHGVTATFFIASGFLQGRNMWNDVIVEAVRRTSVERLDGDDLGLGQWSLTSVSERRRSIDALLDRVKYFLPAERDDAAIEIARRLRTAPANKLMMSAADVVTLARAGMSIGGHTVNHPILRSLQAHSVEAEITTNKVQLERLVDAPIEVFAYPNGRPGFDYGEREVELVRRAGFIAAMTTQGGTATSRCDRFQLPRFGPWRESAARFRLRVLTLL